MFLFQNFLLKMFSLIMASALWFFVVSSNNIELTKDIDIKLDLPPQYTVSSEVPNKVSFRLMGSKFFLRTVLNTIKTIRIDLTRAKPGRTYYNITADMLHIPIGVEVLSISPSRIYLEIEPLKQKTVSIKIRTKNEVPGDMRLVKLQVEPKTVAIKGPKSVIDKTKKLKTQIIDLSQLASELNWKIPVQIENRNLSLVKEIDPPLQVIAELEPKGSNFRISGVPIELIGKGKYSSDTKTIILFVRASKKLTKLLKPDKVKAHVNLKGLKAGKHLLPVGVRLPKGVKAIRIIPSNIRVEVK